MKASITKAMNAVVGPGGATVAALLLVMGCQDASPLPFEPRPVEISALLQSATSEPTPTARGMASGDRDAVAWIAFASGELEDGFSARIANVSAGITTDGDYEIVEGGLDPVAIAAQVGDTIEVRLTHGNGRISFMRSVVPLTRRPRVIRTEPSADWEGVAVTSTVVVVFSEPIDTSTGDASTIRLMQGGEPVAGRFSHESTPTLAVEFVPAEPLLSLTAYTLTVGGVRDLAADVLVESSPVEFTTGEPPLMAFVRDQDIYALNLDGSDARLTSTGNNAGPAWSPDGAQMAFASDRGGSSDIYVMNADGSGVVRRTDTSLSPWFAAEPAWSPAGDRIAFSSNRGIASVSAIEDGSASVWLTDDTGFNGQPAWSPAGDRIAFVSDRAAYDFVSDLYLMDADGANLTQVTQGFAMWPSLVYYLHPAWSPDGRSIAFVRGFIVATDGLDSTMRFMISVMSVDGSSERDLAWAGDIRWRDLLDPGSIAWSPKGSMVAFTFVDCDYAGACSNRRSIKYVTADGSEQRTIVADGHDPSWRR